jgi:hypothetical protein
MSTFVEAFTGPKKPKVEPIPTRDTAAESLNAEDEHKRRIASGVGAGTVMLSGPGGVSAELTGTRSANG